MSNKERPRKPSVSAGLNPEALNAADPAPGQFTTLRVKQDASIGTYSSPSPYLLYVTGGDVKFDNNLAIDSDGSVQFLQGSDQDGAISAAGNQTITVSNNLSVASATQLGVSPLGGSVPDASCQVAIVGAFAHQYPGFVKTKQNLSTITAPGNAEFPNNLEKDDVILITYSNGPPIQVAQIQSVDPGKKEITLYQPVNGEDSKAKLSLNPNLLAIKSGSGLQGDELLVLDRLGRTTFSSDLTVKGAFTAVKIAPTTLDAIKQAINAITAAGGVITGNLKVEQTLTAAGPLVATNLDASTIAAIKSQIPYFPSAGGHISGDVSIEKTLTVTGDLKGTTITALQTKVDGQQTTIGALQTKVGGLETTIGTLQTKVDGQQTTIVGLQTSVATLTGDITTLCNVALKYASLIGQFCTATICNAPPTKINTQNECTKVGVAGVGAVLAPSPYNYCYCCCYTMTYASTLAMKTTNVTASSGKALTAAKATAQAQPEFLHDLAEGDGIYCTDQQVTQWYPGKIKFHAGDRIRAASLASVYLRYQKQGADTGEELIVPADHLFLVGTARRYLKRAADLIRDDALIATDGQPMWIRLLAHGVFTGSFPHIMVESEEHPDCHLIATNGIVSADFSLQIQRMTGMLPKEYRGEDVAATRMLTGREWQTDGLADFIKDPEKWPHGFVFDPSAVR